MSFPRWLDNTDGIFLREVAPDLWVGAQHSVSCRPWRLVIDLHGVIAPPTSRHLSTPFPDGGVFPDGALTQAHELATEALESGLVLCVCEVGRSRSASVGYALLRSIFGLDHTEALMRIKTVTSIPVPGKSLVATWPRRKTLASAKQWADLQTR